MLNINTFMLKVGFNLYENTINIPMHDGFISIRNHELLYAHLKGANKLGKSFYMSSLTIDFEGKRIMDLDYCDLNLWDDYLSALIAFTENGYASILFGSSYLLGYTLELKRLGENKILFQLHEDDGRSAKKKIVVSQIFPQKLFIETLINEIEYTLYTLDKTGIYSYRIEEALEDIKFVNDYKDYWL